MLAKVKRILVLVLVLSMLVSVAMPGLTIWAVEASDTLLHLDFSDASQVMADSYSAFYSNRDVFTKHGNGTDGIIDLSVENGKLVIANKSGWGRPVIRFNASFATDIIYRINYTIAKADTTKSLSVGHLVELTGVLDGSYPGAPAVTTESVVVAGDSAEITMDFYFTKEDGVLTFHSGDYTTQLPANADLAAMDYAIMLGGEGMDCTIDDFTLTKVGEVPKPEEVDTDALLHLTFGDASQIKVDSYSEFYSNRDVFTKHGNGTDGIIDLAVENGKLAISNKSGWGRPVIRFNHGFQAGKTYRIEYVIEKADPSATLSVEHLFELTGSLDGGWPTAPALMTPATVIDGNSATVSVEFSFAETADGLVLTVGEQSVSLPAGASVAALDYNIVLGGTSTAMYIDSFKLLDITPEAPAEEEVDTDALLHLTFGDASQIKVDSYSEFYSNRDVFTKHGNGTDGIIDLAVENGKLAISNKSGWGRPVIRFNHGFQAGKTYRIEYVIEKADPSATLSVEHLFELTGSLDGGWPTAPALMTPATVIDGNSATVSVEFSFAETADGLVLTVGEQSVSLPAGASVAALDYNIVLGGTSTAMYIDSFKLFDITPPAEPDDGGEDNKPDSDAMLYLDFSDASQAIVDSYGAFYNNRDVFTKHGNGGDGVIDMSVENGKLVITNKSGWGRPVIRFGADFEMDTIYRIEYTVEKLDSGKSLSVEQLIQLTGALDGGWPTAPDVTVPAITIDGDSAVISQEFYFTSQGGVVTLHIGGQTSELPQYATVAAFDYGLVLGGECADCTIDNFSLTKVGSTEPEPETDALIVFDFETDGQMQNVEFNYTNNVIMKKGDGSSAVVTLGVESVEGINGTTNALLVSDRTSWARPVVRLNVPVSVGNTYVFSFLAKAVENGSTISLQERIEITGSLDGGWPTAAPLLSELTALGDGWTLVTAEVEFGQEGGKLTYTCNGVTAELPAGATLAAIDLNIMAEGADATADYYIDDLTVTEIKGEEGEDDEDLTPEVDGIVSNSFHISDEANNNVDGHMSAPGVWSVNGAEGTTTLTVADSMLQITDRTGNRSVAVRLGGGESFPSNYAYRIAARAKNLEPGKDQTLGYYIQFIGYKDGSYPVLDFGTDSLTLTDEYFLTVSADFEIIEENGVITIVTPNGKKSFDEGVTLAAIDVFLVTGGDDSKASIGIDNFYADYYLGEIVLDFENDKHINNVNSSHHSVPYVMVPNAYGANSYNLEFVENMGADGSRVMHAIGSTGSWRPQIRLSQGTAKIKPQTPYEVSFQIKSADPDAVTKFQIAYDIYYTMPGAPSNYINIQLMSSLVIVNGEWQDVVANLIIIEKDGGYVVTDGTAYRTLPEGAKLEAVDCGFLPITTTDDQTDYYVDNFVLKKLLENPIKMDGVADDADKIVKNGGMEDPMNIGFGRAWAPAENADITLELVNYEAYAGQYSLRISDRKQTWHRAQQRLDDLSVFTEGKKFMLSGAVMAEEDTYFSLSIYVTLGFRDEENPSNINYAAMEVPLSTERVYANVWNDMAGEFGIYRNSDGNLVIANGDENNQILLEIPPESVGIAAIDVWFTVAAGCEENVLTAYCIDNMEMIQSGTYAEGEPLLCSFESMEQEEAEEPTEELLYTDEESGIQIYGDPSAIPVGSQFQIQVLSEDKDTAAVLKSYGIDGKYFVAVKLMKDGKQVQPAGKLTIVLPCEETADSQRLLVVVDGNVIDLAAVLANDTYTATTDILGVFTLAVPAGSNAESDEKPGDEKPGEDEMPDDEKPNEDETPDNEKPGEDVAPEDETPGGVTEPDTGDNIHLLAAASALLVLSLMAMLGMVIMNTKRKEDRTV